MMDQVLQFFATDAGRAAATFAVSLAVAVGAVVVIVRAARSKSKPERSESRDSQGMARAGWRGGEVDIVERPPMVRGRSVSRRERNAGRIANLRRYIEKREARGKPVGENYRLELEWREAMERMGRR